MSWEKAAYTDAGVSMLSESIHGFALTITRAAAGTGTVDGDLKNETDITGDSHALSILSISSVQADDGEPARRITLRTAGEDASYIMHQVGVYGRLGDGAEALLFIMQDDHGVEVPAKTDSSFEIELAVLLAISDDGQIDVTVDPKIESIIQAVLARIAAITGVPNGLATLDGTGKLTESQRPEVDAYTRMQTNDRITAAVAVHNTAPDAHADIRSANTKLRAELDLLKLKYDTDVSANPFMVTFETLEGSTVTGVWNENQARIEF